jgi:hypothetical protein
VAEKDPQSAESSSGSAWWDAVPLEPGQVGCWHIDTLLLWIQRAEREWQIARGSTEGEDDAGGWQVELDVDMPTDAEALERHVFSRTSGPLRLLPVVADRSVVASPRVPLYVPPAEKTTLYVGSPLWVRVEVDRPPRVLAEIPIRRPSDTWFGSSTREGELCYATRTRATLDVANLPALSSRAITPVSIENRGIEPLLVERLKLPVPYLSVHAAADGQLWTPKVTMVGQEERGMASFDVGHRPPSHVTAHLLTSARQQPEPGLLIRAFSLFRASSQED